MRVRRPAEEVLDTARIEVSQVRTEKEQLNAQFRNLHHRMPLTQPQRQHRITRVVPVDDDLAPSQESRELDNGERRDRRRVLREAAVEKAISRAHRGSFGVWRVHLEKEEGGRRLEGPYERSEEVESANQDLERGEEEEKRAWEGTDPAQRGREVDESDEGVSSELFRRGRAYRGEEVSFFGPKEGEGAGETARRTSVSYNLCPVAVRGKALGVIEHTRTPPDVSENDESD